MLSDATGNVERVVVACVCRTTSALCLSVARIELSETWQVEENDKSYVPHAIHSLRFEAPFSEGTDIDGIPYLKVLPEPVFAGLLSPTETAEPVLMFDSEGGDAVFRLEGAENFE